MKPVPTSPVPVRYGIAIIALMCGLSFLFKLGAASALLAGM